MPFHKKTKIIATLGPASSSVDVIEKLIMAGVDIFRINIKHETLSIHKMRIERAYHTAEKLQTNIGILVDLQGPQIRIKTRGKKDVFLHKNTPFKIYSSFGYVDSEIAIQNAVFFEKIIPGDIMLIDDGNITVQVTEKKDYYLTCVVPFDGVLKDKKGVTIPHKDVDLPPLQEQDLYNLDFIERLPVSFVALSYVRRKSDITTLREELAKRMIIASVIAKIENRLAIENISEIVQEADGIMVARGDMGVEIPIEQLAIHQKKIISVSRTYHKPVIVATEMLQSMVNNIRPTRAEATDVANAVLDGADAVMLSSESAVGKYPDFAVNTMKKILMYAEQHGTISLATSPVENKTELVGKMLSDVLSYKKEAAIDYIIVFTNFGYTARIVSEMRPSVPIVAITNRKETMKFLTLVYGVTSYYYEFPDQEFSVPNPIIQTLQQASVLQTGKKAVVVHGYHWNKSDTFNAISFIDLV